MVSTKEDIEMCVMLHHWHTTLYTDDCKVHRIELIKRNDRIIKGYIHYILIIYDDTESFKYESLERYDIDVTTEDFMIFKRDYKIDQILSDDIESSIDKYQSMLNSVTNDYYTALVNYIKSLSVGDPVWYNNSRCKIHKPHRKQKRGRLDIYDLDNHKVIKNVTLNKLQPRTTDEIKKMMDDYKFPF